MKTDGDNKIAWAAKHMPILNKIYGEISEAKPFRGYKIGVCLHIEAKTGYLISVLVNAGAEVAVCSSNPLSTKDEIVKSLVKKGVKVYARKGIDEIEYNNNLQKVVDFKPDLYIDDGADLTTLIHNNLKEQAIKIIGGTEETTTGIIRLNQMKKIFYPIIAVNDTSMKSMFDNRFGTAQSTISAYLTTSNMSISGKKVVVCGYGWCGKGIASRMKGMGAVVIVCEVDYVKANEALLDGYLVMKMEAACVIGDIFITVTGCIDVIKMSHINNMKNKAILMNAGHFDNEIDVRSLEKESISKRYCRENIVVYKLENGREVFLFAEGRLVNLVAGEGHPIEIIDLSFSLQLLSLLYLIQNRDSLLPGVVPVSQGIDEWVAKTNLEILGVEIDKLSEKQRCYLGREGM